MPRILLLTLLIPLAGTATRAQTQNEPAAPVNDAYQGAWDAGTLNQSNLFWNARNSAVDAPVATRFATFRITRNASLATNSGQLPEADRRQLESIAEDIETAAPGSFEAGLATYYLEFPAPASHEALARAVTVGPDRPEVFGPALGDALRRGDAAGQQRWAKALLDRGAPDPALLDWAHDLLTSTAPNAVLLTAGEMDTYTALALQQARGVRGDVQLVDLRMLGDREYRERLWKTYGKGAVPGDGPDFARRLAAAGNRPVLLSPALPTSWAKALARELYPAGLALRLSPTPYDPVPELAATWPKLRKNMRAGPLARNYLPAGALLLEHYRATGQEEKAAALEHELRTLATAIGALPRLYETGVLKH